MKLFLASILLFFQLPATTPEKALNGELPERSAHFAYVDREFIFTVEIVKPGVPLFNFVSMVQEKRRLSANDIRLTLENRSVPSKLFVVDTANPKRPMKLISLTINPRSSFGVRLEGDFGNSKEVYGAIVRIDGEDFRLAPLTSLDFENLVSKVNRLNLGSPDFRDDWRVLRLEVLGSRTLARR